VGWTRRSWAAISAHGLEIDRHVEARGHHIGGQEEICQAAWPDDSLPEHRKRKPGCINLSIFPEQKRNEFACRSTEQSSDVRVALFVCCAAPFDGEEEHGRRRGEDCEARNVEGAEDRRKPVLISLWMKQRTRVTSPPTGKSI
jgi:hypothetical protein